MGSWESAYSVVSLFLKKNDGIDVDRPGSDMEYSALFSGEVPKNTPEVVCLSLLSGELLLIKIF